MWLDILYLWYPVTSVTVAKNLRFPEGCWPQEANYNFFASSRLRYLNTLGPQIIWKATWQHCAMPCYAAMHQPSEQAPSVCYVCCLHLMYSAASRSFVVCPLNFANYKNFAAVCNLWSCFRNAWIKNSRRHQSRKIFRLARLVERFVERLGKALRTFRSFQFFSGFKCYSLSALLRSQPRPAWSERNGAKLRYRLWKGRSWSFHFVSENISWVFSLNSLDTLFPADYNLFHLNLRVMKPASNAGHRGDFCFGLQSHQSLGSSESGLGDVGRSFL